VCLHLLLHLLLRVYVKAWTRSFRNPEPPKRVRASGKRAIFAFLRLPQAMSADISDRSKSPDLAFYTRQKNPADKMESMKMPQITRIVWKGRGAESTLLSTFRQDFSLPYAVSRGSAPWSPLRPKLRLTFGYFAHALSLI
jgi:hypothetical protein